MLHFSHLILYLFIITIYTVKSINPYHALGLQQGATEDQVRNQYQLLKKSAKDDKIQHQLYDDAYQQIMLDSTLEMTLPKSEIKPRKRNNRRNRRRRGMMPRLSDMFRGDYFAPKKNQQKQFKSASQKALQAEDNKNYQQQLNNKYGYRLPPEYDDPSYYQNQQKAQRTIKDENISFNMKAARYILFIGSILLKLTPCFCLCLIWKCNKKQGVREEEQSANPFTKAINGWTGKNRKTFKKNK